MREALSCSRPLVAESVRFVDALSMGLGRRRGAARALRRGQAACSDARPSAAKHAEKPLLLLGTVHCLEHCWNMKFPGTCNGNF